MKIIQVKNTTRKEIIDETCKILSKGGLVIFPTETTYGAGVDATNQEAVDKLLAYKTRREGKPLSIALADKDKVGEYVELNKSAKQLIETFLPGPFTIVSKSKGKTAKGVESEFGTLGIRIPDYDLTLDFLREFDKPVTATSANASGKRRVYKIDDLLNHLSGKQKDLIDLIIDNGELPHNKPSTIIDTTMSAPMTLRQGDLSTDNIKEGLNLPQVVKIDEKMISFVSKTEQETKDIAKRLLLKNWDELKENGLIIGLDGDLGVGKTIFTKGVAEFLQIDEVITSPTYSYINEYDFVRHNYKGKFFHLDVWKIDNKEELDRLDFFQMVKPGQVVVVEWWSQVEKHLKDHIKIKLITIRISEDETGDRQLMIKES